MPKLKQYRYIESRTTEYDLRDDKDFREVLSNCQGTTPTYHKLYQTTLTFALPKSPDHGFWSQSGLQFHDGKFDDPLSIEISAFGDSEGESKGFALMKLISFIELLRKLIPISSQVPNNTLQLDIVDQTRIFITGESTPSQTLSTRNFPLDMAQRLFHAYRNIKPLLVHDDCWIAIAGFLRDAMEENSLLKALILYYLVVSTITFRILFWWGADNRHTRVFDEIYFTRHHKCFSF